MESNKDKLSKIPEVRAQRILEVYDGFNNYIQSIQKKNFKKTTLGGFVFSLDEKKIIMSKENRNI